MASSATLTRSTPHLPRAILPISPKSIRFSTVFRIWVIFTFCDSTSFDWGITSRTFWTAAFLHLIINWQQWSVISAMISTPTTPSWKRNYYNIREMLRLHVFSINIFYVLIRRATFPLRWQHSFALHLLDDSFDHLPWTSWLVRMTVGLVACPALVNLNSTLVGLIRVQVSPNDARLSLIAFRFH